jgi:hypothetical protein
MFKGLIADPLVMFETVISSNGCVTDPMLAVGLDGSKNSLLTITFESIALNTKLRFESVVKDTVLPNLIPLEKLHCLLMTSFVLRSGISSPDKLAPGRKVNPRTILVKPEVYSDSFPPMLNAS